MKLKRILLPVLAGGSLVSLSFGETPPAHNPTLTQLIQADAAPAVDVAALAKKAGFAAHLPKNTEGYFSIQGGYDMYERLQKTEVGKLIVQTMADQGMDLKEAEADDDFAIVKAILGEELFVAFGDTSGDQYVHLNALSKSSNFHQMKMMVSMAAASLKGEDDPETMQGVAMSMFTGILGDPKAGIDIFEKADMPPLTLGFKVSDDDMREQLAAIIAGFLSQALEAGEEAPFAEIKEARSGVELTGITVDGKRAADLADEDTRQEMSQVFGGRAEVDRFMGAVAKKKIHVATGVKGDHVLIYLGGSLEGFKLVEEPADSLVANEEMDFLSNYADKDIRMLAFGEEEAFDKMTSEGEAFASMALGLKAGLAETEVFGDTRDVQTLLGHVAKVDQQLFGMMDYSRSGMVGFIENGFKIESHGGSNLPSIDTKTPHGFSALGDMEDVLLFSNSRSNPEFTGKLAEMIDSLGEASYLMARRVAELEVDDGDFEEFQEGFAMFEQLAAKDLAEIWQAISVDWAQGTDDEGALVIDTKGTMPKIPEVPGVIIEKGRIPRITYVTPVKDAAKLTQSWTRIEKAVTNILKTVKEQGGPEIPMQELIESEKDGVKSFFYPIPTTTNNARPIVAMTEKNFYLSTSQTAVAEMKAKLEAGGGPLRMGAYSRVNFTVAKELAEFWVKLAKENADELFENDFQKDDFMENLPMIEKFIAAFGEMKDMTAHSRKEDGESRMSLHFNMK
ncbi:hypothetical protein V2O64_18115 [Verrucomicrobiaceae bacterium 227]